MTKILFPFLALCGMLFGVVVPASALDLVKDGKPLAEIVLQDGSTRSQQDAAAELQSHLEKISGAKLKIVRESDFSGQSVPIYLGGCRAMKDVGIDSATLEPERFVIKSTDKALYLAGKDSGTRERQATAYAVLDFLHNELGVRFLGPGEIWTVIPSMKTITVSDKLDRTFQPPVSRRTLRSHTYESSTKFAKRDYFDQAIEMLKIDPAQWRKTHVVDVDWYSRAGVGGRTRYRFGHSFEGWWDKYHQTHPEFFAMQSDGKRIAKPPRERLCVSNPALWDEVARVRIQELKDNPGLNAVSICPNDGSPNFYCFCTECQKLDPPEGKDVSNSRFINPATGERFPVYPSLTDRYLRFYNEVTKRIAKEFPDVKVGAYAYDKYELPPVRIKKAEPNLVIAVVCTDLDTIDAWSKVVSTIYVRPNFMIGGNREFLMMPRNDARFLARLTKFSVDRGAVGFDHDSSFNNFDSQGLEYYILCRAMFDPNLDVDKEIKDYCEKAFGKGAAAMERYFDKLEALSVRVREEKKYEGLRYRNPEALVRYFNPETVAAMRADVEEAKKAIGDPDSKEYRRVVLIENTLLYADVIHACFEDLRKGKTPDAGFQDAEKRLTEFCRAHAFDPDADYLQRAGYGYSGLGYYRRTLKRKAAGK